MVKHDNDTIELRSPLTGRVVPLGEVADEAFATKVLGDGIAVLPSEGVLCSPADGRVDQVFETSISRNVKLSEAPGFGMPAYYHDRSAKGAKEYLQVARELLLRT